MLNEIKKQFCEVIKHSQGIENPKVDEIFTNWETNKARFIKVFGGKYIFEYPEEVHFSLDEKTRADRVTDLMYIVMQTYGNRDLYHFIETFQHCFFIRLTDMDYDFCGTIIPKGSKIIKSFKYFVKDAKILEDIQNRASRIIQEDKISGTFCISVHPLDFLSVSENAHNWRSCHALDGEFRAGNLSYMQDKCTCICYIKSKEDCQVPNFPESIPWNNKKWRMLLFIDPNDTMMFAGRQYPFTANTILDFIRNNIIYFGLRWTYYNDWQNNQLTQFNDKFYFDYPHIPIGGTMKPIREIFKRAKYSLHFDDVLESSCYIPYYCYAPGPWYVRNGTGITNEIDPDFEIGHAVTCLHCGKNRVRDTDLMVCDDCENLITHADYETCTCCDRPLREDEERHDFGGSPICQHCWENETSNCDVCGRRVFNDFLHYNSNSKQMVCAICADDIEF